MGKILYIDAYTKPKGVSKSFGTPGKLTGPCRQKNNAPLQKYTEQFGETDKYLECFSVSKWLDKRKEGRKYRTNR